MRATSYTIVIRVCAALGVAVGCVLVVYASLLPFMKARAYIKTSAALSEVKSVEQMKLVLDTMFNFPSPVGDEEVAKFIGNTLFSVITNPDQGEQVSVAVLAYLEPKMQQNNVRHLLLLGRMYVALWQNHHKQEYLDKAEEYYLKTREIGPNLPQPLYALFEIYRDKGDVENMSKMGEEILRLWPKETRIQRLEIQR